jgi:hypothetical protein
VDDVPQLVWPCALPEHLRHSTKPDQRILRAVVSMVLVRMCTDAKDWVEAGAALGFPPDKSRNCGSDSLSWPHHDGLGWLHLVGVSGGVTV